MFLKRKSDATRLTLVRLLEASATLPQVPSHTKSDDNIAYSPGDDPKLVLAQLRGIELK